MALKCIASDIVFTDTTYLNEPGATLALADAGIKPGFQGCTVETQEEFICGMTFKQSLCYSNLAKPLLCFICAFQMKLFQ